MAVASGHLNSTGVLLEVGGVLPMIHGGDLQQTPNTVAASPAASGKSSLFHIYFRDIELGIDSPWLLVFVTKQLLLLDLKSNLGTIYLLNPVVSQILNLIFKILIALDDHSIDINERNREVNSEAASLRLAN